MTAATLEQVIKTTAPKTKASFIKASIEVDAVSIMNKWGLNDVNSQAQIIGHMAVESAGFTTFEENLSYSAGRLTQVWPSRFPSEAVAAPFARNPKALANKVYNGRMGNRTGSDDGWNFRGSDTLQHTGRSEFERVEKRTGLPVVAQPNLLRDPSKAKEAWEAACSYFADRGALAPAKAGNTKATTIKINGGVNGLADRVTCVGRALKVMDGLPIARVTIGVVPKEIKVEVHEVKTTAEISDDENAKRNKAVVGAGGGTVASGGVTSGGEVPKTNNHWIIAGGVVLIATLIGAVVVIHFWKRANQAKANLETQQLQGTMIRAEGGAAS